MSRSAITSPSAAKLQTQKNVNLKNKKMSQELCLFLVYVKREIKNAIEFILN